MTTKQKIEYMIQTLQIALCELDYRDEYLKQESELPEKISSYYDTKQYFYDNHRNPNLTLIHENLKTLGRFAYIVEKEIQYFFDRGIKYVRFYIRRNGQSWC